MPSGIYKRIKHWKIKDTSKMHHTAWNKGKPMTQVQKEKISKKLLSMGFYPPPTAGFKKGHKSWNEGKKLSLKIRLAISDGRLKGLPRKEELKKAIRSIQHYRDWRKLIYLRDKYTCKECGKKGGKLNADHCPRTFAQIIKENNITSLEEAINCKELWDITNGRTLCLCCHKKTDSFAKHIKNDINKIRN